MLSFKQYLQEHIKRVDGQYVIMSKDGSKRLGKYPTKSAALKRLRQIEYFKNVKG